MTPGQVQSEIVRYYDREFDEAARLTRSAEGALELVRTQELLRPHLPPAPASVLDIGGGAGIHARWLTEDGHRVHLVDPVPRHVDQARAAGCTVELGDARDLTAADASYDVVLLLGPLYHLPDRADRLRALREARRVVRPGGLVAVAGISRHAALFDNAARGVLHRPEILESLRATMAGGRHDGQRGFTVSYFHAPDELAAEIDEAGLHRLALHGVEGPGWPQLHAVDLATDGSPADSPLFRSALAAARFADGRPELLPITAHLLALTRAG
jgi:SAM-dependent methyltransferase